MMQRSTVATLAGVILVLIGLGLGAYSAWTLLTQEVTGIFRMLDAHSAIQHAERLTCPVKWASGQADSVVVTIHNPLDKTLNYNVSFQYLTETSDGESNSQSLAIPAQQSSTITLPAYKPSTTALYQFVHLYAISDDDQAKRTNYYTWPSSYQDMCYIRLDNSPAIQQLKLFSIISLVCVIAGIGLCLFVNRKASRLKLVVGMVFALISLTISFVALSYVFRPPGMM
jgi:hypothetical protein